MVTEFVLNDTPLRDLAQWITTASGLQTAAPILGDNLPLPGLDGAHNPYQLGQQRRPDEEGRHREAAAQRAERAAARRTDTEETR